MRPMACPVGTAGFAGIPTGGDLAGPALADAGAASADSPRSNDNPDGDGPTVDWGADEASRSRVSGGPPLAAGWCGASDRSSANPSGGVLLETLSVPGIHPGRAQALD